MRFLLLFLITLWCNWAAAQCHQSIDPNYHVVQEGETLYSIANEYKTSVKTLCNLNNINANTVIHICQMLKIPKPESFIPKKGIVKKRPDYHILKEGETIEQIAKKYGYTASYFRDFNQLTPYENVAVGTKLLACDCTTSKKKKKKVNKEELGMLDEINILRSNPQKYIPYILTHQDKYIKKNNEALNDEIEKLIDSLKVQKPLPLLAFSHCAYEIADEMANFINKTKQISHTNLRDEKPWARLRRKCTGIIDGNENFGWGAPTPRDVIIIMLIDFGSSYKGHRKTLLNPNWTHAACYKLGYLNEKKSNFWIQEFIQQK